MCYEIILFDLDETLFDFKKTEKVALNNLMSTLDTTHETDYCIEVYKELNSNIWRELEEGKITLEKLKVERFQRLIDKLNLSEDANNLCNLYTTFLGEGAFVYEESKEILSYLKEKYKLGVITNGISEVQNKRLSDSGFREYFDDIVISDEVNISKPSSEIFELSLNNLNHKNKSSVLMIGDSLSSDIYGGNNFGVDTCWCNFKDIKNTTDIISKYEIKSLLDLKSIL